MDFHFRAVSFNASKFLLLKTFHPGSFACNFCHRECVGVCSPAVPRHDRRHHHSGGRTVSAA